MAGRLNPQIARYETPRGKQGPFPEAPGNLVSNEPRLWQALQDAASTTDPDSLRYALGCLQLRPTGQIVATDGRQVLVQNGFAFPWESDLLLPANKLFGCREVPQDAPLLVGGGPHRVTLQTGPWTFHMTVLKEGRFPKVDELLRRPEDALTRWQISASEAEFLSQGLSRLRTEEDEFQAVTIDLNDKAVIRAAGAKGSPPTELVLSGSPPSGQALRMATDRRYLVRALRLGFRELLFYGTETAVTASDGQRRYLWMPLEKEAAVGPSRKAIRIESAGEPTTVTPLPSQSKRNRTMPRAKTKIENNGSEPAVSNGHETNGHVSSQEPEAVPTGDTLVAEALALKHSLQDALAKTNGLIAALKRQGRQSRLIESTLRSLRQFQAVTG